MEYSIDVIIPSYRLNEKFLIPIFELECPENFIVKFFLVADNPTIKISNSLNFFINTKHINLIINEQNLGFSKTRNKGINAGKGDWILFLDDDIIPDEDLLINYGKAIKNNPKSIGFIGVTNFPEPINNVTKALALNGSISAFDAALNKSELIWAPTANIALNRHLLGNRRFLETLENGGEDIELLARNSLENNELYISLPQAKVLHPWWDFGKMQTKRMFRYGMSTGDIMNTNHIKNYVYRDFTNTSETFLFLLILMFLLMPFLNVAKLFYFILLVIGSEIITNIIKSLILTKKLSLALSYQMFWHKNVFEFGLLWSCIKNKSFYDIGNRIDVSFQKPFPSPFRLNKWKIIKLLICAVFFIVFYSHYDNI